MIYISLYKKQKEQIKNYIVQVSVDLFHEKGYDNVTVDQITSTVEIAKGTFYNYFTSKKDILKYWAANQFEQFDISVALDSSRSCEENYETFLHLLGNAITEERHLFESFIKEFISISYIDVDTEKSFDILKILSLIAQSSSDRNQIVNNNLALKIQVLNSAIFNELKSWLMSKEDTDGLVEHLIEVMKICLYGMFDVK